MEKPILLLEGFFSAQDLALVCQYRLTPVVHSAAQIEMLAKTPLAAPIDAYLKVNSGMNRLGFTLDSVRPAWNALEANPQVRAVTLMTHFADADGASGVEAQLAWFNELVAPFAGAPRSLANSAALLRFPETRADWVRPGIMLYGCSPFAERSAIELELEPAMTLQQRNHRRAAAAARRARRLRLHLRGGGRNDARRGGLRLRRRLSAPRALRHPGAGRRRANAHRRPGVDGHDLRRPDRQSRAPASARR